MLKVVALGSRLRTDDAAGIRAVELLQRRPASALPSGCSLELWEDRDALTLAHDLLETKSPVLLVDCADMGLDPGDCRFMPPGSSRLRHENKVMSTHGIGFAQALDLATQLGFDSALGIFGIQPFDISPGMSLSLPMTCRLDAIAETLLAAIGSMQSLLLQQEN